MSEKLVVMLDEYRKLLAPTIITELVNNSIRHRGADIAMGTTSSNTADVDEAQKLVDHLNSISGRDTYDETKIAKSIVPKLNKIGLDWRHGQEGEATHVISDTNGNKLAEHESLAKAIHAAYLKQKELNTKQQ